MTTKIAFVANLAYRVFQHHSSTSNGIQANLEHMNSHLINNVPSNIDDKKSVSDLSDNLTELFTMVKSLDLKDVGFSRTWIEDCRLNSAPVLYIHIMENEIFSMGLFVLEAGSRIPLHDHPGMFGILRVLHGSIRCRSFSRILKSKVNTVNKNPEKSWQISDVIVTQPNLDSILTKESNPCLLTPSDGNLHELETIDGPAIFLDILAPPYDHDLGKRECKFYREVDLQNIPAQIRSQSLENQKIFLEKDSSTFHYLMETPQPQDYWCKSIEYDGPSVD